MSLKVQRTLDFGSSVRLTNLPAPADPNDAARLVDIPNVPAIGLSSVGTTANLYGLPGVVFSATNSSTVLAANTMHYRMFKVDHPFTVTELAVEVMVLLAASNIRFGLCAFGTDRQPDGDALLDSGSISSASTGKKTASFSDSFDAGLYGTWIFCSSATVSVRAGSSYTDGFGTELENFSGGNNIVRGAPRVGSITFGDPPTPLPDWTTTSGATIPGPSPLVVMKWS